MKAQFKITPINVSAALMGIILILLVINQTFIPIAVLIWAAVSIVAIIVGKFKFKWNAGFILMIGLYLMYVAGMLWTENTAFGLSDLQLKVPLILIPGIFLFLKYNKEQLKLILYGFFLGLLISFVYSMITSGINYLDSHLWSEFMYYWLSKTIHPTYLAFYSNIAIAVLLIDYITRRLSLFRKDNHYLMLMFVFTFFSLILLSRMGIATSMFLIGILLVHWAYKRKWLIAIFTFLFLTLTPLIMIKSSIWARERLWDELPTEKVEEGKEIISLTTLRIEIWEDALNVYKTSPLLGVGTGDVEQEIMNQYQADNFQQAAEEKLNPHNQFIQTGIAIGALGILLLIAILFYPFLLWKKQLYFGLIFSCISAMFFMTESVLDKQSGVISFAIFYCLFLLFDTSKSTNNESLE